ncbi:hypothetical protein [Glutamicibacter sp. JC586]|uniref:hypothetical protein n=1 Tax=Glutamicibacter sp. JC586 TaxID=2590552 RepID=UPI001356D7B2|nr:hypothetical protein [Glutamicibacter sp. JC586]
MNGFQLRLLGACVVLFVMIGLLSGWSALFATEALVFTLFQFGVLALGLALIYLGENLRIPKANN